ncbi:MAG: sigma-70 family RNA polymerase sigma factor [Sedimentisphaerales bacterium]|nr:sigma-70 family RNA polymerase sigma factor [Sedimentisphaerales bacterium]
MTTDVGFTHWVRRAQLGDQQAAGRLAEAVRQRLYAYIYRLTLNHDLAQDLLQETLLKMVERIKDLEQPERFWCWIFRTALGNVQHHYRDLARDQAVEFSALSRQRLTDYLAQDHDDGLNHVMREELSETIVNAIGQLKLTYRNVLLLRCYEQMSYAQIADQMGCKELRARVLFFRAKRSLSRHLTRKGFGKGLLLTALGLFGLLTAPADSAPAAGTLTAATLHTGPLAALAGIAGTPPAMAVAATVTGAGCTLTTEHFGYFLLFLILAVVSFLIALVWD